MANFEFTQEHEFGISNHEFTYQPDNKIVVRDANGVVQFSCDLNSDTIAIMGKAISNEKYFCFGTVNFTGPKFSKSIRLNENNPQAEFKLLEQEFFGSDDLRDVRMIQHHYHLCDIPIQLDSDGVFLNFLCPGSESDPWYESH